MELLAENIFRMLNPGSKDIDMFSDSKPEVKIASSADEDDNPTHLPSPAGEIKTSTKLTRNDRRILYKLIGKLRNEGNNWEKIAREIASQGYPTVSGKGTWRGVMAKNLYDKQASNR